MSRSLRPGDLLLVSLGAAAGALARWGLGVLVPDGAGFPWTTLTINVVGAFALALLPLIIRQEHPVTLLLGPGLLGGFTTVSTYTEQVRALAAGGEFLIAGLYVAVTLVAGVAAAQLGWHLSRLPEPMDALT